MYNDCGQAADRLRIDPKGLREVRTILVVEDDDTILTVLKTALKRQGYETLEARTAEEARKVCDGHIGNLDLLVTNVMLPRESGPEFASDVSATDPKLKIIFVSGTPMEGWSEAEFKAMAKLPAGSYAFIAKPFKPQELIRKIEELLQK